jgi:hypothetical protein
MFATDRDLLVLEPELFRDVGWAGQRLVKGVGDVSGTTLTLTSQDNTFAAAGVGAGHVVLVDGVGYEVIARLSATTATISRLRPDPEGAAIPPASVSGKAVVVSTFAPQIDWVHRYILRELSIDPDENGDGVKESDIMNPKAFREVEAMGALGVVLFSSATGAVAVDAGASSRLIRAGVFRERAANTLRQIGAQIDTDGDGVIDATRHAGLSFMVRV